MNVLSRLSRREVLALGGIPVAGLIGWGLRRVAGSSTEDSLNDFLFDAPDVALPDRPDLIGLQKLANGLTPLFSRLPAPQADEWLAKHVEFGQTFAQFVTRLPDKLIDSYRRVCIAPLGDLTEMQRRLLADTAEFLERFFGFPVEILAHVSLAEVPEQAQRLRESGDRQVLTGHLLNKVLLPLRENDMAAVVGLTNCDLWDGDFSFLFGQGSHPQRVCICSVARFGDVESGEVYYAACLRRTVGLAVHEIGHVFGLPHCIAYSCRMNGSNNLAESDRRPLEYCPECLPKIWWTCGVDPATRFSRLLEFAGEHRLNAETNLWRSAVTHLAAATG